MRLSSTRVGAKATNFDVSGDATARVDQPSVATSDDTNTANSTPIATRRQTARAATWTSIDHLAVGNYSKTQHIMKRSFGLATLPGARDRVARLERPVDRRLEA